MKTNKIQEEIKNLLKPISQVNKRDLGYFKIDFIRVFRNFTSQMSKAPEESVSSALKDV